MNRHHSPKTNQDELLLDEAGRAAINFRRRMKSKDDIPSISGPILVVIGFLGIMIIAFG